MSNAPNTVRLLVVDDGEQIRALIARIGASCGWEVEEAVDGESAVEKVRETDYDVVLLDIMMPGRSGIETLPEIVKYGHHTAVIMMTAFADAATAVTALRQGATDYLEKPFAVDLLKFRVAQALQRRQLEMQKQRYVASIEEAIRERTSELQSAWQGTIFALARLAESRDDETGAHLIRLRSYTVAIAEAMHRRGLYPGVLSTNFIEWLKDTAPLHDIGKVGIPDAILLKPGKLTADEFEQMKTHTLIGARALEDVRRRVGKQMFLDIGIQVARSHHERIDGDGYPDGLAGDEIPIAARVVSVADTYDALSQSRVYRPKAFTHEEAMGMIREETGDKFDSDVVEAFGSIQDEVRAIAVRMPNHA